MKDSVDQLLTVVYRHYPRSVSYEDQRYGETPEARRLSDAYRAVDEAAGPWRAMLDRLAARFPDRDVDNGDLGGACRNGVVFLPKAPGERIHLVGFLMSYLVPYYAVYGCRTVDAATPTTVEEGPPIWFDGDTAIIGEKFEGTQPVAGLGQGRRGSKPRTRTDITLEPSADEQVYWTAVSSEIESTFGCELLPPDIGRIRVPDVATKTRRLGQATLYDCLVSDSFGLSGP